MKLAIYGTGGTGREVQEIVCGMDPDHHRWDEVLFIDDVTSAATCHGLPIMTFEEAARRLDPSGTEFVIAVGEPTSRELLFERVAARGFRLATVVHPNAFVSASARLGQGVFVKMQSIISADAELSDNVFVQANCVVGHDVHVGEHTQISGFTHIAGGASVGRRCYLGLRATVREGCEVGDDVVVAMGAVVMEKRVPAFVLAAGNPAKYVRRKSGSKVFS